MIGIDTNVLVRYIVQDDPEQSAVATRFIESRCTADAPGFINHVVLCELVWVLRRCYNAPRENIIAVIEQILKTISFKVQEPRIVWQSLQDYQSSPGDFSDHLIGCLNQACGCRETVTFDTEASQSRCFRKL